MDGNQKPKRLLCIVGSMDAGGAETFLMKIYRTIDRCKYQMDFYVSTQKKGFYDDEIISLGGKIYNSVPKTKNILKSFVNLRRIVKKGKYDCVMRVSQHSLSTLELIAARFGGATTLIFRSSNSGTGGGKINSLLHNIFKFLPKIIPTIKIAPSTEAAEFMFGRDCIKRGKVHIIRNAIDVEQFAFNNNQRNLIRKELNIENKFVVGHVGRFNSQKNHAFLIDIFKEIYKDNPDSVLLLVGKGELESIIRQKIDLLGLKNNVIFTGVRSDIPQIMMAMDVFIFPSFYEGMPNTVIEAQATGLPCVISDTITKEVKITESVKFLSLKQTSVEWATLAQKSIKGLERGETKGEFSKYGYDIEQESKRFINLIFNKDLVSINKNCTLGK